MELTGLWAGYVRVSSDEQSKNLPGQRSGIQRWADQHPAIQLAEFTTGAGESAFREDRPSLDRLLRTARDLHAQGIVVYRANRLSRNLVVAVETAKEIIRCDLGLRSVMEPEVNETEDGLFALNEAVLRGQRESLDKKHASRDLMSANALAGRWQWVAPLGYRTNGKATPSLLFDDRVAPVIQALFRRVAQGEPLAHVVESLNGQGFETRRGKPLSIQTASMIIRNRIYVGRCVVPDWGVDVLGDWSPLVDQAVFRRANAELARHSLTRRVPHQHGRDDAALKFITCQNCGAKLTASISKGKFFYYHCQPRVKREGCVRVRRDDLETQWMKTLADLQPDPEQIAPFMARVQRLAATQAAQRAQERQALVARRDDLQTKRDRLLEELLARTVDRALFREHDARLHREFAEVDRALRNLDAAGRVDVPKLLQFAEWVIGNLTTVYQRAKPNQRRALVDALFTETVLADGKVRTQVKPRFLRRLVQKTADGSSVASPNGENLTLRPRAHVDFAA